MPVCVYDNPATYRRECYDGGRLVCFYSFELFLIKTPAGQSQSIPPDKFFFGANIGPIIPGQVWGDISALPTTEN